MGDEPEDPDRTVFEPKPPRRPRRPRAGEGPQEQAAGSGPDPLPPPAPSATPVPPPPAAAPPSAAKPKKGQPQLANGTVLNGIYKITRFIKRGGMGEVYEAINVHWDGSHGGDEQDRVAVKLMLAHLAEDEVVAAMFAKEASTLIKLNHEAIVRYRLSARDSEGRPYIVLEFIPGSEPGRSATSLDDQLGQLKLSEAEFVQMTKSLAAGLGSAHRLDVIHRDISPDNVLLERDDISRPKIIDFGIAKDARKNAGTLIGTGFAGKEKYVAPEQLGEYGQNVGPWTDVYSLALTMRAVAMGKHSDMGGSPSDILRKRQSVPDLSALAESVRPVFAKALAPDPKDRFQSMEEFIRALDQLGKAPAAGEPRRKASAGAGALTGAGGHDQLFGLPRKAVIGGGVGVAALVLLLVGGVIISNVGGGDDPLEDEVASVDGVTPGEVVSAPALPTLGTPEFAAAARLAASEVPCSWLTFDGPSGGAAVFAGGAGDPAAAQEAVRSVLAREGVALPSSDFSRVVRFSPDYCAAIDALKTARSDAPLIGSGRDRYVAQQMDIPFNGGTLSGVFARPLLNLSGLSPGREAAMIYVGADRPGTGGMEAIAGNMEQLGFVIKGFEGTRTGDGASFNWPVRFEDGQQEDGVGMILISSDNPLPTEMVGPGAAYDAGWAERFAEGAREKGWKADIVWLRFEREL
jgi:serine/threonine-protein kinase